MGLPMVNVFESTLESAYGEVMVNSNIGFHKPLFFFGFGLRKQMVQKNLI
jgi:hypothetical protein